MIGSLIIGSGDSAIVVFRAIGPSLASSGIANPLLDPTIELHDGNGAVLGFNDDWRSPSVAGRVCHAARSDRRPRISDRRAVPRTRKLHRRRPRQRRHHRRRARRSLPNPVTLSS